MRTFGALIRAAFDSVQGWLLGGIGLVLAVLALAFAGGAKVPLWIAVAIAVAFAIVAVVFYQAARIAWSMARKSLPSVLQVLKPPPSYVGVLYLLIAEASDQFTTGMAVTIYLREDEYERLVGVGRVITVQENHSLQIGLDATGDLEPHVAEGFEKGEASFIRRLIVRPSIPTFILPR